MNVEIANMVFLLGLAQIVTWYFFFDVYKKLIRIENAIRAIWKNILEVEKDG